MSAVNAWYEKYASFQLFGVEGVEQK